jgi:hypothetical protein
VPETPRLFPDVTSLPSFPFDGDLHPRTLDDPVAVEPARPDEGPTSCRSCVAPDEAYIWVSERWRVRSQERPGGLPMVLVLEPRSHLDLGDLPNMLAAELGVMTVRLERAIRSLDGVSRVHVNQSGDDTAHLQVRLLARPHGRLQLRGAFLSLWDEILPQTGEGAWREDLAMIAAWLADFGGTALAESPHIEWQAPARFGPEVDAVAGDSNASNGSDGTDGEVESVLARRPGDHADAERRSSTEGLPRQSTGSQNERPSVGADPGVRVGVGVGATAGATTSAPATAIPEAPTPVGA